MLKRLTSGILPAISTPIRTHSLSHLRFPRQRKLKGSNILINRKQRDNLKPFCFDDQCLKVWVISQHIFCIPDQGLVLTCQRPITFPSESMKYLVASIAKFSFANKYLAALFCYSFQRVIHVCNGYGDNGRGYLFGSLDYRTINFKWSWQCNLIVYSYRQQCIRISWIVLKRTDLRWLLGRK